VDRLPYNTIYPQTKQTVLNKFVPEDTDNISQITWNVYLKNSTKYFADRVWYNYLLHLIPSKFTFGITNKLEYVISYRYG